MESRAPLLLRQLLWLIALLPCAIALVLSGTYLYLSPNLPSVTQLSEVELQAPMQVFTADGLLIAEFGEKRRTPISYGETPVQFEQAILAAEDNRFYSHNGVDLKGLTRAVYELLRYRTRKSGGSTITMQVARNFFLTREQTFLRKFNEIILALQIETELSKQEILELYINKIYLGHRAYGIAAAAQVYYGKTIDQLNLAQLAMIAGLPKAPSAFNPITNPERALIRRNWILGQMLRYDYINEEIHQQATAEPVSAKYHGVTPEIPAAYLAEMVRATAVDMYKDKAYTAGLKFYTTAPSKTQLLANNAIIHGLHAYDERHGYRGHLASEMLPLSDNHELIKKNAKPEEILDSDAPSQPMADEQALTELNNLRLDLLKNHRPSGKLKPALVLSINPEKQTAQIFFKNKEEVELVWPEVSWATPFISVNKKGKKPETISDILQPGDIILVRPSETKEGHFRLAQVPQVQGALVILNPKNGAILGMVGGYDFHQSNFNRAIQGGRQAGSIIKPFVYSSALSKGFTAASIMNDAPIVYEDSALESSWRPENSGGKFLGPIRLRQALYQSRNLVSIRLLKKIGVASTVEFISKFGVDENKLPRDLSLALGSASLTPLELATAYATFPNGGFKIEPYFITRITDRGGKTLFTSEPLTACLECEDRYLDELKQTNEQNVTHVTGTEVRADIPAELEKNSHINSRSDTLLLAPRAIDERVVFIMNSMLEDVIKRGTGRKARALQRGDIGGKTGTTNEQKDAWFSGYNPEVVATAWVGFDDPKTLGRGEYGGTAALPVWINFMEAYLKGKPETYLRQPDNMVSIKIDPVTGERSLPGARGAIFEIFRKELAPEQRSSGVTVESVIEEDSALDLF